LAKISGTIRQNRVLERQFVMIITATNRMRDGDGEIRHKRRDTLVGTLRDEYGENFAKNYRSDAKLGTVLEKEGFATTSI
jgi:hypothetical protein